MAAGDGGSIPAGKRHGRAREEVELVRGKAKRLGVRRIERGGWGLAGATPAAALLDSAPPELEENEGKGKTDLATGTG